MGAVLYSSGNYPTTMRRRCWMRSSGPTNCRSTFCSCIGCLWRRRRLAWRRAMTSLDEKQSKQESLYLSSDISTEVSADMSADANMSADFSAHTSAYICTDIPNCLHCTFSMHRPFFARTDSVQRQPIPALHGISWSGSLVTFHAPAQM